MVVLDISTRWAPKRDGRHQHSCRLDKIAGMTQMENHNKNRRILWTRKTFEKQKRPDNYR